MYKWEITDTVRYGIACVDRVTTTVVIAPTAQDAITMYTGGARSKDAHGYTNLFNIKCLGRALDYVENGTGR